MTIVEPNPIELSELRRAAAGGEAACRAIADFARPGVYVTQVEAAARNAIAKTGGRAIRLAIRSISRDDDEEPVIGDGDLVVAELAVASEGVEARQSLSVAIGEVHPDHARCAAQARAAYEAALSVLRPGVSVGEVLGAMRSAVGADVRLEPHLEPLRASSFAVEPHACIGPRCVRIGGTVLVTERGAEELNPFPSRLRHVRIVRSVSANA